MLNGNPCLKNNNKSMGAVSLIKALFSNIVAFRGRKANCHFYYVEIAQYF